jgi:hypothetical protein
LHAPTCVQTCSVACLISPTVTALILSVGISDCEIHWLWSSRRWDGGCITCGKTDSMVYRHCQNAAMWSRRFWQFANHLHIVCQCEGYTWQELLLHAGRGDDLVCDTHRLFGTVLIVQRILGPNCSLGLKHADIFGESLVEVPDISSTWE